MARRLKDGRVGVVYTYLTVSTLFEDMRLSLLFMHLPKHDSQSSLLPIDLAEHLDDRFSLFRIHMCMYKVSTYQVHSPDDCNSIRKQMPS